MTKERNSYDVKSDHDLLIELNVKMDILNERFEDHKKRHWSITMALISAMCTGSVGFIMSLVLLLVRVGVFKMAG